MFESVLTPIAWTFTILVLLCLPGSSIPDLDGPVIPHFDKLVHFLLFAVFSGLWNIYLACKRYSTERLKRAFWLVFFSAIVYGTLLELVQYFLPDRSFDPGDIAADAAGAAAAYAYSYIKLLRIKSGN